MKATLLHHNKVTLVHQRTDAVAIAELRVLKVEVTKYFPEGIKYSLFLVDCTSGEVLVGLDNHKPKGHHLHIGSSEVEYDFTDMQTLVDDFWDLVKKKGFLV